MTSGDTICGVDEAGRGPLAGPVLAAAVILDPRRPIAGLADSKKLTPERRDRLAAEIRAHARAWSIALASVEEIDRLNIRQANLIAMKRAVAGLAVEPTAALVDGNDPPDLSCPVTCIVGGDATEAAISAASILAKTARDQIMHELDAVHPGYGFRVHKGYGVPAHLEALQRLGPCAAHRRSFRPVRERLAINVIEPSSISGNRG